MIRELINTIKIDAGNLEHIAKTGKINGTLLIEIERVMTEFARQSANGGQASEATAILPHVSESKWLIEYADSDITTAYVVQKADTKELAVKYFKEDFGDLWIVEVNKITHSR